MAGNVLAVLVLHNAHSKDNKTVFIARLVEPLDGVFRVVGAGHPYAYDLIRLACKATIAILNSEVVFHE